MVISVPHDSRHGRNICRKAYQMTDQTVCPVGTKLLLQGSLGSWFHIPKLSRLPVSPLQDLELGNWRWSVSVCPTLSINEFPFTLPHGKGVGRFPITDSLHESPETPHEVQFVCRGKRCLLIQFLKPLQPPIRGCH